MSSSKPSIRPATEADLPAMLALLLTSFRQFSLFSFLYSPLKTTKDAAFDTIWVWRRRLLLGLLDPSVSIIVAELDEDTLAALVKPEELGERRGVSGDSMVEESWKMLEWVETRGALSQSSTAEKGKMIVGFAIWRVRLGKKIGKNEVVEGWSSWTAYLRSKDAPLLRANLCVKVKLES
jgi:hypothetical protein